MYYTNSNKNMINKQLIQTSSVIDLTCLFNYNSKPAIYNNTTYSE